MTDKPNRIGTFRQWLLLIAAIISTGLFVATAEATASQQTAAGQSATPVTASPDAMPDYVHGLLLDMKGDYWGAIESFRKVMAERPADAAVKYSISKAWYRLAVLDSAKAYGEAAVKLDPSNRYYPRYLAGVAHDQQDYARAAELYGQAALAAPDRTDIMYQQGVEYVAANRPEEALQVYHKAVRIDPYNDAALSQTLMLEIGLKRYTEAIDTVKQLTGLRGSDRKLGITLAELYTKTGQEELAIQTLRELVEADRSNSASWVALFDHYIRAGRNVDFHRELLAFLDTAPPSQTLHDLAKLYVSRSAKDSLCVGPGLVMLDEFIASRPHDSELFILKGMYGLMHEPHQEALASFSQAVKLDSGNASAWEYLITAQLDLGGKRKAFELLAQARRRLPGERLRWSAVEGSLLLSSHAPKRAAVVLEKVVRAKKKLPDQELLIQANTNLAMAYDLLGLRKRSRKVYERLIELDPHNALAMNNIAYLFADEGIMLHRALRLATNAVMLDPDNSVYLDTLGWVHFKLGNYELARQLLEKALAIGLDEPEVYRHLGEAYRKLGNDPKAREMFEKAKSVNKR
jgi:tetratricopeptide (TPR) repeat protein